MSAPAPGSLSRTRPAQVLALFALANLLSYASRNVPFAVYDDLRAQFGVDEAALGWLGTAFMLPHALATLPVGWLADRLDRRRVVAGGLVLWSLGGLAGALATTYVQVVLSRVLVGLGTATAVPVANAVLGQLYAGPRKAFALAIFNLGLFLGGVAGFGLGAKLGYPVGWIAIALPGFLLAALLLLIDVPHPPPHPAGPLPRPLIAKVRAWWAELRADLEVILRVATIRRVIVATTVMAFAAGGYQAWLLDFLRHDKGMSEQAATSLLAACLASGLAGVVAGGRVADRLRRRRAWGRPGAIALGMALTVPCATACVFAPDGPLLWAASLATMFFISWYHGPMAASVDDVAPPAQAATAQATVIFTMHLLGTAPSSRVLGEIYVRADLRTAMLTATGAVAVAAALMTRAFSTFATDAQRAQTSGATT